MALGDTYEVRDSKAIEAVLRLSKRAQEAEATFLAAAERFFAADSDYQAAVREAIPSAPTDRHHLPSEKDGVLTFCDVGKHREAHRQWRR